MKTKRPGTSRCPGLFCSRESLGGLRLCASSTRLHLILVIARPQIGPRVGHRIRELIELLLQQRLQAETIVRSDAHEHVAGCGASAVDADRCSFHVGSCWRRVGWTVNSLYTIVNCLDKLFSSTVAASGGQRCLQCDDECRVAAHCLWASIRRPQSMTAAQAPRARGVECQSQNAASPMPCAFAWVKIACIDLKAAICAY